jgi:UDP-N-acetylmuramoyl-tripeptide--D-alanyl-D-alanine ligase
MRLVASEAAAVLGARLVGPDAVAEGATFDSRTLAGREMFVAVRAERDGHGFAGDAISRGAGFVLCERVPPGLPPDATFVVVHDTVEALGMLARHHRRRIAGQLGDRVVGITGSVGKTSTKDFIVSVLSRSWPSLAASHKSFNNDLGVPITVLSARDDAEALVLEMGMRGMGQISRLCEVAEPVIGVVTAVADAHTEMVGGIEGVARAKAELVAALPGHGTAILNADDPRVAAMSSATSARVLTYGSDRSAMVRFSVRSVDEDGCQLVEIVDAASGSRAQVLVPVPGVHMASNAAGAVAVGVACGLSIDEASAGIATAGVADMRMTWRRAATGLRVLDDSYNANPASMAAALRTLAEVPAARRVAVLGFMAELVDPGRAHREVADIARECGIEVIAVGTDLYGIAPTHPDQVVEALSAAGKDTVVVVKGSRVAGLDDVVRRLVGH